MYMQGGYIIYFIYGQQVARRMVEMCGLGSFAGLESGEQRGNEIGDANGRRVHTQLVVVPVSLSRAAYVIYARHKLSSNLR
jgi:hypothetical protein